MFAHDKASSSTHPLAVSLIGGLKSGHICSLGRRWAAMPRWHGDSSPQRRIAEMQGISKVLQFTVVKERSGVSPPKFERLEELDFLRGSSGTERSLLKEFLQPPLLIASTLWLFNERKLLNVPRSHSAVQNDLRLKVARSMSQDSIRGSRKETQFSFDTLNTSVSRNSRIATRISS